MEVIEAIQIIGAGGHAKVVVDAWITQGGRIKFVADDDILKEPFLGQPVIRPESLLPGTPLIVTIGNNDIRLKVVNRFSKFSFARVIHPRAIVSDGVSIGQGTAVLASAVINPNANIGQHVIVNTGAIVEHDCQLGDGVHVAPGAVICGEVSVGLGTLIGAGATIAPGIKIGANCIVGAGAVVVTNLPDNVVAVGNPARVIKPNL